MGAYRGNPYDRTEQPLVCREFSESGMLKEAATEPPEEDSNGAGIAVLVAFYVLQKYHDRSLSLAVTDRAP